MEILTNKTLWADFDPTFEPLDVNVARTTVDDKYTVKKVYFTAKTFDSGRKIRACATVCIPHKATKNGALFISKSHHRTKDLQDIASTGFVSMHVDLAGRKEDAVGTMYPEEVEFCNAEAGKDWFYFGENAKQSKLYQYSVICMRAITYLLQEEQMEKISVVTVGKSSLIGMIVCAQDKRVANGIVLFGKLHVDYPEMDQNPNFDNSKKYTSTLEKELAYEDIAQAWTLALAPQSYSLNIDAPIYVVNSANSPYVDIMQVDKMYYRINDKSRMLIVADVFENLQKEYIPGLVAWCKGETVNENYDLGYFVDEKGNYFVKIVTENPLSDTVMWYCTNGQSKAKHWVKANLTQGDGCYVAKLDLYQKNCTVVAFAELKGKINISTTLLTIDVKEAKNLKIPNNVIFSGEGNQQLIPVGADNAWTFTNLEYKRKKGYLGIVGAKGRCLATFALADTGARTHHRTTVTFDVSSAVQEKLTIALVCNFGITNDIYTTQVDLDGDERWQRVTVELKDFCKLDDGKQMADNCFAQLLAIKADHSFLVNNIILV